MNVSATVQIGKNGLTESVYEQINTSLEDHELVKIGVLKTADVSAKGVIAGNANSYTITLSEVLVMAEITLDAVKDTGTKL